MTEKERSEIGTELDAIRTSLYAKKLTGIIWPKEEIYIDDLIEKIEKVLDKLQIPYPLNRGDGNA